MKRFILFSGLSHYAEGGIGDFKGDYDTWQAAVMVAKEKDTDWWHVFDTVLMKVLYAKQGSYTGQLPDEIFFYKNQGI